MLSILLATTLLIQGSISEQALLDCAEIDNKNKRLACFDDAVGPLREAINQREELRAQQAIDDFGRAAPKPEVEALEELELAVTEARLNRAGDLVVTLENGQVWRQSSSNGQPIRNLHLKKVKSVIISKAAMQSHRMRVEPLGRSFKAKRVR